MPEQGNCRSCGAALIWIRSDSTGALMPLDASPVENGNVVIKDGVAHVINGSLFEEFMDGLRYRSHFASCPAAQKHRKKGKEKDR